MDAVRSLGVVGQQDPADGSVVRLAEAEVLSVRFSRRYLGSETLLQERLRLDNRQHAAGNTACQALVAELQAPVLAAIAAQITRIDPAQAKLAAADTPLGVHLRVMATIPGLGLTTAAALLARLPLDRFLTPRQVPAYVGLCPQERSSGSSMRGRGHIGPLGPASVRKALSMPAIVAIRCNPALRVFAQRLRANGKRPKVVITAVMRKLLLLAWALLRTGQPFSPPRHVQLASA
jgi:transposase